MNDIFKADAAMAALVRKATSPAAGSTKGRRESGGTTPTRNELTGINAHAIKRAKSAREIFDTLPEMETIVTIAASSILSTKDLVTTALIYDSVGHELPIELNTDLTSIIRKHFDESDKLPRKLYRWIYDAMSTKGSVPVIIVPESGMDEMFSLRGTGDVAQESRRMKNMRATIEQQWGLLGDINGDKKVGIESIFGAKANLNKPQSLEFVISDKDYFREDIPVTLTITDNPNILHLNDIQRRLARENASSRYQNEGSSSYKTDGDGLRGTVDVAAALSGADINPDYEKARNTKLYGEIPVVGTSGRSVGHPLVRISPGEAILPVSLAGEERNPIGYLGIIDATGNFISARTSMSPSSQFNSTNTSELLSEDIISRANTGMGNSGINGGVLDKIVTRYGELAEEKLLDAIRKGMGGAGVNLSTSQSFYQVMFSRHLAKEHTQVLYIPAENLAYFAVDFNDDGVGVSITERSMILSTIRMSLMFATMSTATLNASRNMQFDIELAPEDSNPRATIAAMKADIINSYNSSMPKWGDVEDAYAAASNSGIAFNITGNDYYGSAKVAVSDTTPDYKTPDPDIDESFLRRTCNLARVDPDLVLTPNNIEFAAQIFSKSLIVTQQVTKIQEELSVPISRYVRSFTLGSGILLDELAEVVATHLGEERDGMTPEEFSGKVSGIIGQFIGGIHVTIPPPDTSAGQSQMEQFTARTEYFEKVVEYLVDDTVVGMMNDAGFDGDSDTLRKMVVGYYVRTWLRKNDLESDLLDIFYTEGNDLDTSVTISNEMSGIAKILAMLHTRSATKIETSVKSYATDEEGGEDSYGSTDEEGGGDEEDYDAGGEDFEETDEDTDVGDVDDTEADAEEEDTEGDVEDFDMDALPEAPEEPEEA